MASRLADGEYRLQFGRSFARLRPTLRAAYQLDQRYGLEALALGIEQGNISIILDIIREGASESFQLSDLLDAIAYEPICDVLATVKGPLTEFVLALFGIDPDEEAGDHGPANSPVRKEPVRFVDVFERLFAIGTGWLGWSPRDTWNASPREIIAAFEGRQDMLRSIFGSTDAAEEERIGPVIHTEAEIAEGLAMARLMAASGQNRSR